MLLFNKALSSQFLGRQLLLNVKRGTVSTSPSCGPEKPFVGDIDNIHAYTRKSSCSLATFEISQVSGRKTSITLLFYFTKIQSGTSAEFA